MGSTLMETYSGELVDCTKIEIEDINPLDIAHSLSMLCRFGGHCRYFYSVAEHSIYCHDEALRKGFHRQVALFALLHDAGEAYWQDLGTPLKNAKGMEGYCKYLDMSQDRIGMALNIIVAPTSEVDRCVKNIDLSLLKTEALRLMKTKGVDWESLARVKAVPIPWWKWLWYRIPGMAKRGFIRRLRKYGIDV